MNEQESLLSQLNDIHKVSADAWPLAWGWWALTAVLIITLALAIFFWIRQRRFSLAQRQAITEIKQINDSDNAWPSQMNQVLKRAALAYYPAHSLSGLYGQRWTQFMVSRVKTRHQPEMATALNQLQDMLYQPAKPDPALFKTCQQASLKWLKRARFQRPEFSTPSPEATHV